MTNPHFFTNCTHDVIQVEQKCTACCKKRYTSILLTCSYLYSCIHDSNQEVEENYNYEKEVDSIHGITDESKGIIIMFIIAEEICE